MKRYNGEQYTEEENNGLGLMIVVIIVSVICAVFGIISSIAYLKAHNELKTLKQQTGQEYNLEGALTISASEEQQIQLLYNGGSYFPSKVQLKEGIVLWDANGRIYCADRMQVQINIIALTKSA